MMMAVVGMTMMMMTVIVAIMMIMTIMVMMITMTVVGMTVMVMTVIVVIMMIMTIMVMMIMSAIAATMMICHGDDSDVHESPSMRIPPPLPDHHPLLDPPHPRPLQPAQSTEQLGKRTRRGRDFFLTLSQPWEVCKFALAWLTAWPGVRSWVPAPQGSLTDCRVGVVEMRVNSKGRVRGLIPAWHCMVFVFLSHQETKHSGLLLSLKAKWTACRTCVLLASRVRDSLQAVGN